MSAFLSKLVVEQVEDTSGEGRGTWKLVSPLIYQSDIANQVFTVPVGFVTDFASVPRIPLVFDWLGDRGNLAATLHDWLYTAPHPIDDRGLADDILHEALLVQGVGDLEAEATWAGVRIWGASHWD